MTNPLLELSKTIINHPAYQELKVWAYEGCKHYPAADQSQAYGHYFGLVKTFERIEAAATPEPVAPPEATHPLHGSIDPDLQETPD